MQNLYYSMFLLIIVHTQLKRYIPIRSVLSGNKLVGWQNLAQVFRS